MTRQEGLSVPFVERFYVNEGLRAAMVFEDNMASLRDAAIIGVFAAVVFILGIIATQWEEGK